MNRDPHRKGGFSLLELLAVMSIVAMLSTLAITSYFSAVRGMASRSARRNFTNALTLARQRACVDGCRVSLLVFNEAGSFDDTGSKIKDLVASYVVCRELGRFSYVSGNYLFDEFSDLDKLFEVKTAAASATANVAGARRLYNLSIGSWSLVRPYVENRTVGSSLKLLYSAPNKDYQFRAYAFERLVGANMQSSGGQTLPWKTGDSYGIEVAPVQSLPKGFTFQALKDDRTSDATLTDVDYVTFEPDGSVVDRKTATFKILPEDRNAKGVTFTVSAKGEISISN